MADIGQRSGLINRLSNPENVRLGGNPFPNAHLHAVYMNVTDPPPGLLTDTSTGAGTLSASPVLALMQRRRASILGGHSGEMNSRLSSASIPASTGTKPGVQPPSLNLYLLATLQQVRITACCPFCSGPFFVTADHCPH